MDQSSNTTAKGFLKFPRTIQRNVLWLVIFLFSLGCVFWFEGMHKFSDITSVRVANNVFQVETVVSSQDQAKGLGGRENLCPDCAMLFLFDKPDHYAFWMKDMRFPLDILWIDGDQVVFIAHNVTPESTETIIPPVAADKVLEVNAGITEQLGIGLGSVVKMR